MLIWCYSTPAEIADVATFDDPTQKARGISHVFVNGRVGYANGESPPTPAPARWSSALEGTLAEGFDSSAGAD